MHQRIFAGIVLSLMAVASSAAPISGQGTWETTLQGRLPATPGGTNYQAYYDTSLNITWVADANLAATNTFGVNIGPNIYMTWFKANEWIAGMNSASYLGMSDWRLPSILDTGTPGCNFAYAGTDCGYNVQTKDGATVYSELAHLQHVTLGNLSFCTTAGVCPQNGWGLSNQGPFLNFGPRTYWATTQYPTDQRWYFDFNSGNQDFSFFESHALYAWAVRPGDIAPVPVPAAAWLLGSALGVLGWMRRGLH